MSEALIKPFVSGDPRPVEKAVINDILDEVGPLKWLIISFKLPTGGIRWYDAWTTGGDLLGDQIDDLAMARGFDGADWFEITGRHEEISSRGKISIRAYDLPSIRIDVDRGHGATNEAMRNRLYQFAGEMAKGFPGRYLTPAPGGHIPWAGVGPRMCTR